MTTNKEQCPFKVGDAVVYRPSDRGRGLVIMTDLAALKPANKYKIARINDGVYVVVEGFENAAGGGLYWTEFAAQRATDDETPVSGRPGPFG
jgi:hypothetical protein